MLGVFLYIFELKKELLVCFSLSILYLMYYLVEVVKRPVLHCRAGEFRALLQTRVPLLQQAYWPTPWCVEARLQTVLGSVLRSRLLPPQHYRREVLRLSDGGQVALDWAELDERRDRPVLLVLPGLTGGGQADYARCLVGAARELGAHCVVFSNRGLGGLPLTIAARSRRVVPGAGCSVYVLTADAAAVLRRVARRPGRGGGGAGGARRRPAAGGRRVAGRPHPGPLPGRAGRRRRRAAARRARRVRAAGRARGRAGHGGAAAQRAAVAPHGRQPVPHRARARAARRRLARARRVPHGAPVRRGLHGAALRLRVGGRVLRGGHAARPAGARARAAAVPAGRRRPLPARRRAAGAGGGRQRARGAGGHGARRAHRLPGRLVARAARHAAAAHLPGAPRRAVLPRRARRAARRAARRRARRHRHRRHRLARTAPHSPQVLYYRYLFVRELYMDSFWRSPLHAPGAGRDGTGRRRFRPKR